MPAKTPILPIVPNLVLPLVALLTALDKVPKLLPTVPSPLTPDIPQPATGIKDIAKFSSVSIPALNAATTVRTGDSPKFSPMIFSLCCVCDTCSIICFKAPSDSAPNI